MNLSRLDLPRSEKIGLISNFATMLSAGIPILETVDSLLEDATGNTKKLLEVLRADLVEGKRVHVSLIKFPRIFNHVSVNLIKASEEAGTLAITLKDLKDSQQKEQEFIDKIRSAFMYPLIILIVFICVLVLILVLVVPKISEVFKQLGAELPLPTRVLIAASNILLNYTYPLIAGLICGGVVFYFTYKRFKSQLLAPLLYLPYIRGLIRDSDLTRIAHNLHLLLGAGLPLTTALDLIRDVPIKKETKQLVEQSYDMVMAGRKISDSFKDAKKRGVPATVVKLIEVGDKTGTLDKAMKDVAEYLDYRVSTSLKTFTLALEPIILVVVGVCVGGVMMAILAPIYGIVGQIQGLY